MLLPDKQEYICANNIRLNFYRSNDKFKTIFANGGITKAGYPLLPAGEQLGLDENEPYYLLEKILTSSGYYVANDRIYFFPHYEEGDKDERCVYQYITVQVRSQPSMEGVMVGELIYDMKLYWGELGMAYLTGFDHGTKSRS